MKTKVLKPSQLPEEWKNSILGFDIETEDKYLDSPICLVSLYKPGYDYAVVVPIKAYTDNCLIEISDQEKSCLIDFLSSVKVIGHNLQFDLSMIKYQWGLDLDVYFDTFILARMLQLKTQGLKDIFTRICPQTNFRISKFNGVMEVDPPFYYVLENQDVITYSALDAVMPFHIMRYYRKQIEREKKILDLEMNYLGMAIQMRSSGLQFDFTRYQELFDKYQERVSDEQYLLNEEAGFNVRVSSTADLTKLLVDNLGCVSSVKTPKGAVSMNVESLNQMLDNADTDYQRKVVNQVLELKRDNSILSSSKKIPNFVIGDRLHFHVEQIGYDGTARVYTKDASVNQIPKELRDAIVPSPGKKFVMFDWSSAELYIAAYWSKCQKILDWYHSGVDLHTEVSKLLLGKENISKAAREISKVLSFATIYGSEGGAVSRRLNISEDEGRELVQLYLSTFPEIANLRAALVNKAHQRMYTVTMMGRRRLLPDINSDQQYVREGCERQAFNTAIQASCADFFKMAACRAKEFEDQGIVYKFGVFDSHLLEVPVDMELSDVTKVADRMSDFTDVFQDFKFRYNIAEGESWFKCQEQL